MYIYNLLAFLQICSIATLSIASLYLFGTTSTTDAYYLSLSALGIINLIYLSLIEQFVLFYIELKSKCNKQALGFYYANLITLVVCLVGTGFFLTYFFNELLTFFYPTLSLSNTQLISKYSLVIILSVSGQTLCALNEKLLNAETEYVVPYIFNIFPNFASILGLYFMWTNNSLNIFDLYVYACIGWYLSFFAGIALIFKRFGFSIYLNITHIASYFSHSINIRLSHNVHNILCTYFNSLVVLQVSEGALTAFSYATKILNNILNVTIKPDLKISFTELCEIKQYHLMEQFKDKALFFFNSINRKFFYVTLTFEITLITLATMMQNEILYNIFIFTLYTIPWYSFMAMESIFVQICTIYKNTTIFWLSNIFFSLSVYCLYLLTTNILYYFIGLALLQAICSFVYYNFYNNLKETASYATSN